MAEERPVWHALIDDQQIGPMTMEQMKGLAREGRLDRETLVWCEGMGDWQPVGQVPELDGSPAPSASAPTPPPLTDRGPTDFDPRYARERGYAGEHFDGQQGRTNSLIMLLWLMLAAEALVVVLDICGTLTFEQWNDANADLAEGQLLYVLMMGGLGMGILVGFVVTVVLFCMWAHRANRNARALGATDMDYTPGWTVGWFFIPIANLWKPYQAIKEVYKASEPDADGREWRNAAVPNFLGWWWTFWIINNISGQVEMRMVLSDDPETVEAAVWLAPFGLLLSLAATWFAIKVIKSIQQRQLEKAGRVLPNLQRERY